MPPHHVYNEIVHKALSSHVRKTILLSLSKHPMYLSEIAVKAQKKPQTIDFHLNILKEIGLVEGKWDQGKKYYSIKDKRILDILKEQKTIPPEFKHKPPHEIVLDAWKDLSKRMDRIEKKLDKLIK